MPGKDEQHVVTLRIAKLDCPDCAASLEKAVQGLPGVASAELHFAASKLRITPQDGREIAPAVIRLAESMGYRVEQEGAPARSPGAGWPSWVQRHRRDATTISGAVLALAAFVSHLLGAGDTVSRALYGGAIVVGGIYIARAGWVALVRTHTLDMNVLMSIAAVGAMFVGEFAEGAVTVLLFSVGELLESYSLDRARNAIRTLMELAPAEASRLYQGQEQRVSVAALSIGDHVLVRPGERLATDGRVLEGRSAINQAPITGESLPVERGVGDEVFAGTVNGNGALTVEVTHLAANTTLARIMRLVEEAQAQRAPAQRFVDRFARVYTPIVIGLAVGVATLPPLLGLGAFGNWFYRALVLLVIACPCALVISTPVTIVSALARAARSGVLIKGGRHLEQLASLRVIAFDKTGTLTRGEPYVVGGGCELHPESLQCSTCDDLVAKAAAIEGRSEHALARAVTQHAEAQGLRTRYAPGENVVTTTGMGIEGLVEGHNVTVGSLAFCRLPDGAPADALCAAVNEAERLGHTVLVIQDACCSTRCYLTVSDTLRSGVPQVLREVKRAGIKHTVMLTGDNAHIAAATGEKAGIDEVRAGLLPEDKVRAVEEMRMRYGQVAMVGDGVNDAPAMAKASLGIAMGAAGTDTALETADIALMGDDLSRLPFAIRLSRSTLNTVRANIVVALALKALFLALAVGGVATLWMAVLADTGASLLVSLNGLRMLAFRDGTRQRGADGEQA